MRLTILIVMTCVLIGCSNQETADKAYYHAGYTVAEAQRATSDYLKLIIMRRYMHGDNDITEMLVINDICSSLTNVGLGIENIRSEGLKMPRDLLGAVSVSSDNTLLIYADYADDMRRLVNNNVDGDWGLGKATLAIDVLEKYGNIWEYSFE